MKTRFNTYDIICSVTELQQYIGLRVNQVYDIDHKTYLIRLQKTDEKVVILLESGSRIHTTDFEWPKNVAPSGFSMKLRKHLKNKRLESLKQLGLDRIVDLQFGTGEAAYHVILELYDRGNIILTDCDLTILYVLRPHTEGDRIRFAVKEKYPTDRAREYLGPPSESALQEIFSNAKAGDNLKKILNPHLEYGPAIIDHILLGVGLQGTGKLGKGFETEKDLPKLLSAFNEAEEMLKTASTTPSKGFIIQKSEKRPTTAGGMEDFLVNQEFHPFLFRQHAQTPHAEFESFDKAVDNFFSSLESQKIDMKAISQEKEALKKLDNVKKDHDQRLQQLSKTQESDTVKAEMITKNQALVDHAIKAVRGAIANQMSWPDIKAFVKDAAERGDPIASCIKYLKLEVNHIALELSDPYEDDSDDSENDDKRKKPMLIDIDLDLSAFANARKYYDQKRSAAKKQQKTLDAQGKAFKSAEKKTKQTLKDMKTIVNISKARKVYWFEKFFWFISSENYLVIGGRDMIQNELIVKRYMRPGDIYVHADIHGASSVVIKNPSGEAVPPKTLNEAGVMAICYSVAWDAKVVTTAWWVHSEQVSKTAPSGEYLSAGSFMVRGKKNFLPPGNLVMGFSFLFKLEEGSVSRHKDERKVKSLEDDMSVSSLGEEQDEEVVLSEGDDDEDDEENHEEQQNEEENRDSLPMIEEEETNDEEAKDEISYPDTEIKIHHTGKEVSLETKSSFSSSKADEYDEDLVVYLGDDKPVIIKPDPPRKKQVQLKNQKKLNNPNPAPKPESAEPAQNDKKDTNNQKKGKKSKKNKKKDEFEDEEDRQLRLEILQNVVVKKSNKRKKNEEKSKEAAKKAERAEKPKPKPVATEQTGNESGDESEEEVQEPVVNTDLEVLNSLTGIPMTEDEILFAVPVVAPYNAVQNYKFKVKITPGTGKRGKAAKTALEMFLRDKNCTQREKDLLKSVKDEAFPRNLPGKVKVSAPHLHKK